MLSEDSKQVFYKMLYQAINYLDILVKKIEDYELTNEQFVLDWFDKINEISVKH